MSSSIEAPGKKAGKRIPVGLISSGIIGLILAIFTAWSLVVDEPFGGEPATILSLETTKPALATNDIAVLDLSTKKDEQALKDENSPEMPGSEPGQRTAETEQEDEPFLSQENLALSDQPRKELSVRSSAGLLPRIAPNGLRPLDAYAGKPQPMAFDAPKVVLILDGMGLSDRTTDYAIEALPAGVTFAFMPYANRIKHWASAALRSGHELFVQVPMEPFDYPDQDPGPHTLLTNIPSKDNIDRLRWVMARMTNYVGIINYHGARFTSDRAALEPVMKELVKRGLLFFDDGQSTRSEVSAVAKDLSAPIISGDMKIDRLPEPDEIDARLLQLEGMARARGFAIGTATALPVTIERIAEWSRNLADRGVVLVPATFRLKQPQS